MSYEKPDKIPSDQNDLYITLHTTDLVRGLELELSLVGLRIAAIAYFKNEYCGSRERPCNCPHWLQIKVENLHNRIYEPNVWFWVCRRKRVYEIRFRDTSRGGFVEDDFWINTKVSSRTQTAGSYIHSYGLKQAASDIKIAHQAAEIKHYKSKNFDTYYAAIFKETK